MSSINGDTIYELILRPSSMVKYIFADRHSGKTHAARRVLEEFSNSIVFVPTHRMKQQLFNNHARCLVASSDDPSLHTHGYRADTIIFDEAPDSPVLENIIECNMNSNISVVCTPYYSVLDGQQILHDHGIQTQTHHVGRTANNIIDNIPRHIPANGVITLDFGDGITTYHINPSKPSERDWDQ